MKKDSVDLWIKRKSKNTIEGRTKHYWIKVRRKKGYFDILIGKKGEEPHIHDALYPNYEHKFLADRGKLKSVRREVIKKNKEAEIIEERTFGNRGEPRLIVKFRFNSRDKEGLLSTYLRGITLTEKRMILVTSKEK